MSKQEMRTEERLEAARRGIKSWRAERLKLGPMPGELWAEAIALASEVGVARVARALEMDHTPCRGGSTRRGHRRGDHLWRAVNS